MFCPLCKAEYRQGFTTCSDCHATLVPTQENLEAGRTRFWRGDREEKLDRILAALKREQIPFHFKEVLNHPNYLRVMGIPVGKRRPAIEYEVWVLRSDLERARHAVAKVLHALGAASEGADENGRSD